MRQCDKEVSENPTILLLIISKKSILAIFLSCLCDNNMVPTYGTHVGIKFNLLVGILGNCLQTLHKHQYCGWNCDMVGKSWDLGF